MAITIDKDQLIRLQNEKLGSLLMELEIVTTQRDAFHIRLQEQAQPEPEPKPQNRAARRRKSKEKDQ